MFVFAYRSVILVVIAVVFVAVAPIKKVTASGVFFDSAVLANGSVVSSLFASIIDRNCASEAGKCIPAPIMKVIDYGVKADGVTDDSTALSAALKKASEHGWSVRFPASKTIIAASSIIVPNGIPDLSGGTINFTGKASGFLLNGKHEGLDTNVRNLRIHDIVINIGEKGVFGIRGSNVSNVTIDNVGINGNSHKSRAILLIAYANGGENSEDIVITNNRVTLPGYEKGMMGVELASELDFGKYDGAVSLWKATKSTASAEYLVKNLVIHNNSIDGGYYGISLVSVAGYDVRYNVVRNNMRNISAQHRSDHGRIYSNTLRDSVSSSIHLAYGSSDNIIKYNDIKTDQARGEGLVQAYVGAKRNLFEENTVTCSSQQGAKYLAYSGVHADNNIFRNNAFIGTYSRAALAIEAAWSSDQKNPAHRNWDVEDDTDHEWANHNTDGVIVEGNKFDVTAIQTDAPKIIFSEIKNHLGVHRLTNLSIRNNVSVRGNSERAIYVSQPLF